MEPSGAAMADGHQWASAQDSDSTRVSTKKVVVDERTGSWWWSFEVMASLCLVTVSSCGGRLHLRALVDGVLLMPGGSLQYGFHSTPGGAARDIQREVREAELLRSPDGVCLLATSNNPTRGTHDAAADFRLLLE